LVLEALDGVKGGRGGLLEIGNLGRELGLNLCELSLDARELLLEFPGHLGRRGGGSLGLVGVGQSPFAFRVEVRLYLLARHPGCLDGVGVNVRGVVHLLGVRGAEFLRLGLVKFLERVAILDGFLAELNSLHDEVARALVLLVPGLLGGGRSLRSLRGDGGELGLELGDLGGELRLGVLGALLRARHLLLKLGALRGPGGALSLEQFRGRLELLAQVVDLDRAALQAERELRVVAAKFLDSRLRRLERRR